MRTSEEGCGGGGGGGRRVLLFCLSPSRLATFLPRPDRSWLLPSVSHRLLCSSRRDVLSSGKSLLYPRPSQSASTGVCQSGRGERRGAGAFHHPCRSPGGGLWWPSTYPMAATTPPLACPSTAFSIHTDAPPPVGAYPQPVPETFQLFHVPSVCSPSNMSMISCISTWATGEGPRIVGQE